MIKIEKIYKSYEETIAVNQVSLSIQDGTILGLLGPNGAGKTTIVKSIVGILRPDSGDILINGINNQTSPIETKKLIGYVPEDANLFENLTGHEYLELSGQLYQVPYEHLRSKILTLTEQFEMLSIINQQIKSYSKGNKQKLLIIAALLHNPPILVLDEPFSGLDTNISAFFRELIKKFAQMGKTILISSHILDYMEKLCDEIAIIHQGSVLLQGNPQKIIAQANAKSLEELFIQLTDSNILSNRVEQFINKYS